MVNLALYIHVPFCRRKCEYCDFVSYSGRGDVIPAYFEGLRREFSWYIQRELFTKYELHSIYIGGGTPSLATDDVVKLLHWLYERIGWNETCEITMEVNPATISPAQCQQVRRAGCNRISIGVQSFQDDELKRLGRIHDSQDALRCVESARQSGFDNLSLDLMFGLPGSSMTNWQATLRQAVTLKPEHISCYNLSLEEGTPFWTQHQQGKLVLPDEDQQIRLYERGIRVLTEAGYEHYEISNCARPGYRSRHNQVYWNNASYLGAGAGAHSYLNGTRYWNEPDLNRYLELVSFFSNTHKKRLYPPTVTGKECLDLERTMGETIMMNLRLMEGICLSAFEQHFGHSLEIRYAETLTKLHSLHLIDIQEDWLRLTPKGILVSNMVFEEFITA